jgi:hypothetical protein
MAKRGLRSIGINKIIPAQIDFAQIVSGSAAGPGSFVAISSDGKAVLVNAKNLIDDSLINHDLLTGFVANEHVDHTSVSITAGNGLTGGGTIAATRTVAVGAGTGITVNASDVAFNPAGGTTTTTNSHIDHILINDGGVFKKIAPGSINISGLNNDSGFTTNVGDITGVDLAGGTGIDIGSETNTTSGDYSATISVDVSDFMTNGSNNRIVTATGADAQNAEANLTFDGTTLYVNGDTGIGTDDPKARLHVYEDLSAPDDLGDWDNYQVVIRGGIATGKAAGILLSTSTDTYGGSAIVHYDTGTGTGDLAFYTKQSTAAVPPVEVMRLTDDGRMGVGNTTPEGKVHIKQAANGSADNYAGDALVIENVGGTQKWYIGIDSDDDLVFAHNNPAQASAGGYIRGGVDINSIDFTGQHRSVPSNGSVSDYSDKVGMIVVSTGEYYNHSGSANTVDSALPKISLSSTAKDKSVYGIVSSITDENSDNQTYNLGTFGTMFPKSEDRVIVNALGEGSIWVTNINGNFENGDYITTSIIPGYGMKQDDDLLHNYTAAKITQDCNFDLNSSYECEEFEHNGVTYKRAFVGCTYHCG